jgi:aspartate aminotransferase
LEKRSKEKQSPTASDFSMFLLEEAHVATVTGEAFGNDACIRISYAASVENIQEAVTANMPRHWLKRFHCH